MACGDQLAAVLREIAEMEESEGFIGPKISTNINAARELIERASIRLTDEDGVTWSCVIPREWIQDIVVGEIGRACDERGWRTSNSGPYLICGGKIYMANIEKRGGLTKASELLAATEGPTLALAAATAYRDALKEMM